MIESGESFIISYGSKGKRLECKALTLGSQRRLTAIVKELVAIEESGDGLSLFDLAAKALEFAVPEKAEELIEQVDAEQAIEIASKVLGKQALSDDELGKFESPH